MQRLYFVFLLILGFSFNYAAVENGLNCQSLPIMYQIYLRNHLSLKHLNQEIRQRTADQLIKNLDPSKVSFLEEEVQQLKKKVRTVFDSSYKGDCSALAEIQKFLNEKSQKSYFYATSVLNDNYVLDKNVEIQIDPQKRGFPKTEEDRQKLQLKLIHFQITNYILGGMDEKEAVKSLLHRYEVQYKKSLEKKPSDILDIFMSSFASALDPHSSYLSPSRLEDFQISMHLSLEGIGAQLTWKDGYTIIDEIIPGGAADRVGSLRPKDKILAVAQDQEAFVNIMDMDLSDVVQLIRGKKGTKVRLSILRQAQDTERFEVLIVRDKIDIKDSAAKMEIQTYAFEGEELSFAILELPSFYGDPEGKRSSYKDVKKLLLEANEKQVDGLILNLSRNGGGLLEDAVRISGLFLHRGAIVATKSTNSRPEVLEDSDPKIQYKGPLLVLTSRRSASASEILAGAIKDYQRGIIVGDTHTFGKGTVQMFTPISEELGGVTITTGMFFRPSGKSTQEVGVSADIILPSIWDRDDLGEKSMDYVLPNVAIQQFRSFNANNLKANEGFMAVKREHLELLSQNSLKRTTTNEAFVKILSEKKEADENKDIVSIAELLKKNEENKDKDKADEKKTRNELIAEYEKPYIDESMAILSDLIHLQRQASAK